MIQSRIKSLESMHDCIKILSLDGPLSSLSYTRRLQLLKKHQKDLQRPINEVLGALIKTHGENLIPFLNSEIEMKKMELKEFLDIVSFFEQNTSIILKPKNMREAIRGKFKIETSYYLQQIRLEVLNRSATAIRELNSFIALDSETGKKILEKLEIKFIKKTQNILTVSAVEKEIKTLGFNCSEYNSELFFKKLNKNNPPRKRLAMSFSEVEWQFVETLAASCNIKPIRTMPLVVRAMIHLMAQGAANPTELIVHAKNMLDEEALALIKIIQQVDYKHV